MKIPSRFSRVLALLLNKPVSPSSKPVIPKFPAKQPAAVSNLVLLANNVKALRETKQLKREELSLLLNFDNSYISKVEKCRVNITIDKISKIANYFEVDVIDLFTAQQ